MLCWGVVSVVPVVVLVFVREKIRPAWFVGDENGIKLSQQEQNAPNGEILGVQGEFCTGTGTVQLVQGEFCTGTAGPSSRGVSFVPEVAPCGSCGASFVPEPRAPTRAGRVLRRLSRRIR